jgi:hypothetical protein
MVNICVQGQNNLKERKDENPPFFDLLTIAVL